MRSVRRWCRPALLFTTALLLSSCGIPETGVVEAGEPATGIRPAQALYFVSEGVPLAVRRQASGPVGIEAALEMLFQGPDDQERRKGVITELPPLLGVVTVRTEDARVVVELPWGTGPLSKLAIAQLTCTVVDARRFGDGAPGTGEASTEVTVTVPDAWRTEGSSGACPTVPGAR
ncbi:hypothetical protein ACFVGN_31370 [Streptomyces sp. NPDC057757]|uniref:hypothetical protein n=1 Tax=Streptomyces sp. NPDC057757 TaxID=3346241 RepID=UPI003680AD5B